MKRLVLVGAGHAHALVLRELARNRPQGIELVLVAPVALAPYSGMVPGWLAGHYRWEECCIDFALLCRRSGVTLRLDSVAGLDPHARSLRLGSGQTIDYDWLSLNVGATLMPPDRGGLTLPMRPLGELRQRWESLQETVMALASPQPFRLVTVGGGAAGVETALATAHSLRRIAPHIPFQFSLVTEGTDILPGMAAGAVRRLRRQLAARGIEVMSQFRVGSASAETLQSSDGRVVPADAVLWATGAQPYAWLRESGLGVDADGFVAVDGSLRSLSHSEVFAAGDCAGWLPPLPKAGVFSVRMGPVLAHNLLAVMERRVLQPYAPQRRYLALIGTGNANAIAAWGRFSCQGRWFWRWKQAIDRRFVAYCNEE